MANERTYTQQEFDSAVEAAVQKERSRLAAVLRAYQEIMAKKDESNRIVRSRLNKVLKCLADERAEKENLRCKLLQQAVCVRVACARACALQCRAGFR